MIHNNFDDIRLSTIYEIEMIYFPAMKILLVNDTYCSLEYVPLFGIIPKQYFIN